ncbi:alpha/beta fold hydrolase [Nitratireductor sp. CAU 1489]|uniref:Alpha/beta fold hydrolase n=1 Tax=Nitratireductor arenosus TaxID=2682096 RepID=A0A844QGQ4_9HYPH|nr:alpha/beta hydrolase [Nitratireductor arenosus]MVA99136.1 alpha/beta fold hydrolase [Nitratireductor arenosus]
MWTSGEGMVIRTRGVSLEGRGYGPTPERAPTIVLLHEGLGCVELWRDFPQKLAEATGYGVFAYSRQGYGRSDAALLPRPLDYMTREAVDVLPDVLKAIGFKKGVLAGHSDGASIAAIYAGSVQDHRVRGLVLMAPHFFTEPMGLDAIRDARQAYDEGDLRARLGRYHRDVDNAFRGWNDAWLDPTFEAWNIEEVIAYIRVPVLAIQGVDDQYGTRAQIEALETQSYNPVDVAMLEDCRHSPHIDQPDRTLAAMAEFVGRLDAIEAAEAEAA